MQFLHPNFTKYIYSRVQNWARKGFLCVENCKNATNTFQLAARIEINRNCVTENRKPKNSYFDCAQCYTFAPYESFWLLKIHIFDGYRYCESSWCTSMSYTSGLNIGEKYKKLTQWEPKSKSSDNPCLLAVHKLARNHRFWKAKSFYNWWIPIYDTSKCLKWCTLQYLLLLLWIFLSCSLQLVSFIEKSNFSVYGVYIWKSLKNSFHMYQMQNLLGNDSYKKYAG